MRPRSGMPARRIARSRQRLRGRIHPLRGRNLLRPPARYYDAEERNDADGHFSRKPGRGAAFRAVAPRSVGRGAPAGGSTSGGDAGVRAFEAGRLHPAAGPHPSAAPMEPAPPCAVALVARLANVHSPFGAARFAPRSRSAEPGPRRLRRRGCDREASGSPPALCTFRGTTLRRGIPESQRRGHAGVLQRFLSLSSR